MASYVRTAENDDRAAADQAAALLIGRGFASEPQSQQDRV